MLRYGVPVWGCFFGICTGSLGVVTPLFPAVKVCRAISIFGYEAPMGWFRTLRQINHFPCFVSEVQSHLREWRRPGSEKR